MRPGTASDYFALAVSSLLLIIVLIATYVSLLLYHQKTSSADSGGASSAAAGAGSESFVSRFRYEPSCSWGEFNCARGGRGLTTGAMPAIDSSQATDGRLCCGCSEVPPWPM